jgi:peptide/nickel transport system substrate-binding protein
MLNRKLWVSFAMLAVGVSLLAAATTASARSQKAAAPAAAGAKTGGTFRVDVNSDTDYIDPALAYYVVSWQWEFETCVKLLNYPEQGAKKGGSNLIPEAAAAMPVVSNNGRTYTFTVRKGYKFSPPSNQAVTAGTYAFVFKRLLAHTMNSPSASFFADLIQGAQAYNDGTASSISGISVKGNKITFRLLRQSPDFLARMAMPFTCAVPTNTPFDPNGVQNTIAGAGPYYLKQWVPNRSFVLVKNPNWKGSVNPQDPKAQNWSQIVYTVGKDYNAIKLEVQSGQSDWGGDGMPPTAYADLWNQYGPNSKLGKAGKQQFFVNSILDLRYEAMNTSRPLFAHANLRRALNFAIDRKTIQQQNGSYAGKLTDQILPPAMPGYSPVNTYPTATGPNIAQAQKLAGSTGQGQTAVIYTCNSGACPNRASVLAANLATIGIKADIQQFKRSTQFVKEGNKGEPYDIADEHWGADYADPFDFVNVLLDGNTIKPANNDNFAYFNDPSWNAQMEQAANLSGNARWSAYAKLDAKLTSGPAPWASYSNGNERDFFSARIGCQTFQPVYQYVLGKLCVR